MSQAKACKIRSSCFSACWFKDMEFPSTIIKFPIKSHNHFQSTTVKFLTATNCKNLEFNFLFPCANPVKLEVPCYGFIFNCFWRFIFLWIDDYFGEAGEAWFFYLLRLINRFFKI
jgi:hypothetical protein